MEIAGHGPGSLVSWANLGYGSPGTSLERAIEGQPLHDATTSVPYSMG